MKQYQVEGMTCASCQAHVEKAVSKVEGVTSVSVSLLTNSMQVEGNYSETDLIKAVSDAGYGAHSKDAKENTTKNDFEDTETPKLKKRLLWSSIFLILLMYVTMGHNMLNLPVPSFLNHNHLGLALVQMLLTIKVMIINRAFFISGFKSLFHLSPNMDTLVALGSGVSFAWSIYVFFQMTTMITNGVDNMSLMSLYHNQLYFESAAMILAFITIGKTLESISKGRTTDALKNLMKMAPSSATIEKNGEQITVSIEEVQVGDIFLVKPGEAIPVDGVVIEGSSAVDESALTGESIPVDKNVNDSIAAATINTSGFLKAKATRIGADTAFSQIIQMVTDAAGTKAPIARIADKVSGIFVPAVIGIAFVVFVIWLFLGKEFAYALEKSISVLVISCPCALGLATPVAIMVGNGVGAKNGILFKTSEALENTSKLQTIVLDKTGTITLGKPSVTDVIPNGNEKELLNVAVSLESKSEHPLALAVMNYGKEKEIQVSEIQDFTTETGNGLSGTYNGKKVYGGSRSYIQSLCTIPQEILSQANQLAQLGKTPIFFMEENELLGLIGIADTIKEDSVTAIQSFHKLGLEVVMLTGDNEMTAQAIGKQVGVDRIVAGVLPKGKEEVIQQLQKRGKVAMVGDGINDAPSLTRADIGIAIGAGTDVAIDSADIVLMNSTLSDVAAAIRLSRSVLRNIHENLFWAFAYNIILIPMAAGLYTSIQMNPMWGAAAMSLSSFTVCMNALRLNLCKVHDGSKDHPLKNRLTGIEEIELGSKPTACPMEQSVDLKVSGMMCTMCEKHVTSALQKIPNINGVEADYKTGIVRVTYIGTLDEEQIQKNLEKEDYTYEGRKKEEESKMNKTVKIEGMMCEHCEMHAKKALEGLDGVTSAKVSHTEGTAVLECSKEVSNEVITNAVKEAGYTVTSIA